MIQNGHHLQILHADDTGKTEDAKFITLCQVDSSMYVTRFAKTRHNGAFLEIRIFASINFIYLKLCSVVISMLYCKYFQVTRLDSKVSSTLALYEFLRWLMLHKFNYTIVTYGYFNIRNWNKDHSTQHEMEILITCRLFSKYNG